MWSNVFLEHVKRAVWQIKLWVNARDPSVDIGTPLTHGWEQTNQGWIPLMYEGPTAAEMIEDLFCECERGEICDKCPCFLNALPCIDVCNCGGDIGACHYCRCWPIMSLFDNVILDNMFCCTDAFSHSVCVRIALSYDSYSYSLFSLVCFKYQMQ